MARGVNRVILVGNLGGDPEGRYLPNGTLVASLSLATAEAWKDKNTGENQERTEWHRVVIYGRAAEVAREYLRKGSQMYVEGKLRTRKWQDQQGQARYTTEVVCDEFQMLSGRRQEDRGIDQLPPQRDAVGGAVAVAGAGAGDAFGDDDIPF